MLRLTKFLITLPLLTLPLSGIASKLEAEEVMGQMDALRLLAKSRAADSKCKVLAAGDSDELNSYVARAEVAATRYSVSEVQSTISVGRALGSTATCSDATTGEINATLAAARQAMAAVQQAKTNVAAEDQTVPQQNMQRRKVGQPETLRRVSLAGYGRQAFAYYVERRCEYLSRRDIRAFWAAIVREHKAALAAFGGPAVAGALRRARSQAEAIDCDSRGRQLVRGEYTNIARN